MQQNGWSIRTKQLGLIGFFMISGYAVAQSSSGLADDWSKPFEWRQIGPSGMGGRVTAIAVNPKDASMYWIGLATGGVAKTVNNGVTFEMQFSNAGTSGVGDLAVSASNPDIVWLGSGESNPRNSVSYGDGVYRSDDGGKTWKNMGLRGSFQIGKVMIHPTNPDIVYVGVTGRLWGPSDERGLYKTTDGGKNWSRVLFVNDRTGVIDAVMNPRSPDTVVVAMWERERDMFDSFEGTGKPKNGYDGYDPSVKWGPGSGLWKTTNGGASWKRLGKGLPSSNLGRIGLDVWQKDPNVLFAVVDCANIGMGTPPPKVWLGATTADTLEGLRITAVTRNSPAEKAKLKIGDVITAIDGKKITELQALAPMLQPKKAGDQVEIDYLREKKAERVKLTLEDRPRGAGVGDPTIRSLMGVNAEAVPGGLKLTRIRPESPAQNAGLEENDILIEADGKKLTTPDDLLELLKGKKEGEVMSLKVLRDAKPMEFKMKTAEDDTGGAFKGRPYTFLYGGQQPNVQDQQGPNSHEYGGVYRSNDGGDSWFRINSLNPRPMYFSRVRVDPKDDKLLYLAGVEMHKSVNGGRTFTDDAGARVHSDHHAFWINPNDTRHILIGCDGGFYVSYDRTATWKHLNNLALGQFYHVAVDSRTPYWVYGGLQDNGSWGGPNLSTNSAGPMNEDWINVGGGDGFVCRVDPFDPDIVYTESQGGAMGRRNLKTGETASVRPRAKPGDKLRFNWNTPFILSTHNAGIFYSGAQYVFRSVKRGDDARQISPDVTRTSRGSATALSESPRNPDVLWVGTDDGALWVTRDGGKSWSPVYANLGVKKPYHVSTIEASRAIEGRAYVTLAGQWSNDDSPLIFVTEDFGATFAPLRANLPVTTTRCLREDPTNPNVLYCGTEIGAFMSVDRGSSWNKLGSGLPTVPVFEFAVHPAAGDLVAATHGRSIWILDIANARQFSAETAGKDAALMAPKAAIRWRNDPSRGYGSGFEKFFGQNPPVGMQISYWLGKVPKEATLKVFDIEGKLVKEFPVDKKAGLAVVQWDLRGGTLGRQGGPGPGPGQGFGGGPLTPAGAYRLVLTVDGKDFAQVARIERDPRLP